MLSEKELLSARTGPLSPTLLSRLHRDPTDLPMVRTCNTGTSCKTQTVFDTLKLHKIFSCRRFSNQQQIAMASSNAKLIHTGDLPPPLGSFSTIVNPSAGKPLRKCRRYLDKDHRDIVFGDYLSLRGYHYMLILVDFVTHYCSLVVRYAILLPLQYRHSS
jgi:hypothetical protein